MEINSPPVDKELLPVDVATGDEGTSSGTESGGASSSYGNVKYSVESSSPDAIAT